jgi:tRNA threonylcarbamoyladenosine biosynthesis protein TsaE
LKKEFCTKSAEETKIFGQNLSQKLSGGWVLYLEGDLGSGKTTFAKGVALGLGVITEVTSPTFAIEQLYETKKNFSLAHYDFYRIKGKDPAMYEALEKIESGEFLAIIEWGDVLKDYLSKQTIYLQFLPVSESQDKRNIIIRAESLAAKKILKEL